MTRFNGGKSNLRQILAATCCVTLLLLFLRIGHSDAEAPKDGPTPQSDALQQMETHIISEVNAVRKKHDRQKLTENGTLNAIAREYSRQMLRKEFFSHTGPSGSTVADRIQAAGIAFRRVGENLAMTENIDRPAKDLVADWMESPPHRENILEGKYTQTGVGVWKEKDLYYFTQIFLRPMDTK